MVNHFAETTETGSYAQIQEHTLCRCCRFACLCVCFVGCVCVLLLLLLFACFFLIDRVEPEELLTQLDSKFLHPTTPHGPIERLRKTLIKYLRQVLRDNVSVVVS